LPVGGQGLDKIIETINLAVLHFLNPPLEPSFSVRPVLGLLKNGRQFFPKRISLMELGRMGQQSPQLSAFFIIQSGMVLAQ